MASSISTVGVGTKLSATIMQQLKNEVKQECLRRKYTGSVESYGSSTYDYTVSAGSQSLTTHYTKNATPLNAISGDITTSMNAGTKITAANMNTLINKINLLSAIAVNATAHGCASSCTGLCSTSCGNACQGTCTGSSSCTCGSNCSGSCSRGCADDCSDHCSGGCGSGCSGSSSCYCGSNCSGSCSGSSTCHYCGNGDV